MPLWFGGMCIEAAGEAGDGATRPRHPTIQDVTKKRLHVESKHRIVCRGRICDFGALCMCLGGLTGQAAVKRDLTQVPILPGEVEVGVRDAY